VVRAQDLIGKFQCAEAQYSDGELKICITILLAVSN
jgi:hypothetical protein